jgi:hypothetical protein
MSDMSFKQAKELADKLELAEITLRGTLKKIDVVSKNVDKTLESQKKIIHHIPKTNIQLNNLKIIIALNIGFVLGLLVAKYII